MIRHTLVYTVSVTEILGLNDHFIRGQSPAIYSSQPRQMSMIRLVEFRASDVVGK